ncbi:hypothetical protein, partial [Pseudomonas sp. FW305-3-2-15-C-LB1]|uniref:hypothetical protein n=1 Tax=Pseudomonas sp. FW305-3-2-15-C-LB1 TaxID=2751331 RepID=UPI001C47B850
MDYLWHQRQHLPGRKLCQAPAADQLFLKKNFQMHRANTLFTVRHRAQAVQTHVEHARIALPSKAVALP